MTRPPAKPDKQVEVTTERCPDCGTELGDPFRVESKDLAGKILDAVPLHKALTMLYKRLTDALEADPQSDPPSEARRRLWYEARATLRRWFRKEYASELR